MTTRGLSTLAEVVDLVNADLRALGYQLLGQEQIAVLFDPYSPGEAVGMLDELQHRVRGISIETWQLAVQGVFVNTRLNDRQRTFVEARILQAVNEIGARLVAQQPFYPEGPAPSSSPRDFADLHDYCDANTLGGLCDDAVTTEGNSLFPERTDPHTVATQGWMAVSAQIQDAIAEWMVGAGQELRAGEWVDRSCLIGAYRAAFPSFGTLDVDLPIGWWDASKGEDQCPSFRRGLYTLWIDHQDPELSPFRSEMPRFSLELRDELGRHVCPVFQTADWLQMHACLVALPPSMDYLAMHSGHAHFAERTKGMLR